MTATSCQSSRRSAMRKSIALSLAAGISIALLGVSSSDAKDRDHLAVSGHIVANVDHAPAGDLLAFEFAVENKNKKHIAEIGIEFSANVGEPAGYICTLISNGRDINPDTPDCEIGMLRPKKTGHAGVIYTMPATGDLVVKACAFDLGDERTRNSGNCRIFTVHEDF